MVTLPVAERPLNVGEMVVADYRKAEVFRKYGIDYCCGGKKPLEEVCRQKGIDLQNVQNDLNALDQKPDDAGQNFDIWELDALAAHIVEKHHNYVSESVPMLYELGAKVARVHGERHPELIEIANLFRAVGQELQMHMHKEELMLFPQIAKMAASRRNGTSITRPFFGSVENPIHMMESEHESSGNDMEEIRRLSHDFTPPMDACTSYCVLYAKLQEFEQDLHQHVHLENNILFPKSITLEKEFFPA
ncbi:MAG: iron-sulfur cluster repair di-iron protein [Saprospiraceae bacterium]|nr:iron-sulfur cluster repair di-iron protein [Saprospiraceae bacterium]